MSLDYAIMGFLNYKPLTGYELKKIFDTSVRHFWNADQSQIYRTLSQLTDKGWAEMEVIPQTDRPDRKVYQITPYGREELHRWLEGGIPYQANRSAPLIQVFFSGQLSDEEILAKFKVYSDLFRTTLERYNQVPDQIDSYIQEIQSPREAFFWMLTLELGQKIMQTQLEWSESVIRRIENHQLPQK